jgi:multidrug resistance efflux pump
MNPNYSRLPPIPTPPGQRWREFRIRVLPVIFFAAAMVAVGFVWRRSIASPTLQGEVEATLANVASPQAGIITQLKVSRFQWVSKGEPIAVVLPSDTRAPLALLQSEIDVMRSRQEPRLTQQRNATDYERLRLEWLLQKVSVATARVNLARAENELKRNEDLFKSKLISEELYDLSLKNKEALQTEVDERSRLIADLDQGLKRVTTMVDPQNSSSIPDAIGNSVKAQEEKLRLAQSKLEPFTLTAPMAGMVSVIYKGAGENVLDGDPIVAIRAPQSERIVGYLRQPFPIEPEVGMPVEVRTRAYGSALRVAQIVQIGAQLEPITNSLAILRPGMTVDMGLPIAISMPNDLKMRPGEMVDLIIRPRK